MHIYVLGVEDKGGTRTKVLMGRNGGSSVLAARRAGGRWAFGAAGTSEGSRAACGGVTPLPHPAAPRPRVHQARERQQAAVLRPPRRGRQGPGHGGRAQQRQGRGRLPRAAQRGEARRHHRRGGVPREEPEGGAEHLPGEVRGAGAVPAHAAGAVGADEPGGFGGGFGGGAARPGGGMPGHGMPLSAGGLALACREGRG
jgi:hypothetical protein